MRKTTLLICTILIAILLTGCEIVSKTPIDTEYTPAYDATELVYGYKYDWLNGEWVYLPQVKLVHHNEEYKVQYEYLWSDGSAETVWVTVTKEEYEIALKEIEKGGAE